MKYMKVLKGMLPKRAIYFYRSVRSYWIQVRNNRLMKHEFQKNLRSTDVFLVGHPKSGNTWTAYLIAIVLFKDFDNQITLPNLKHKVPYIHGQDQSVASFSDLQNPRVFRNEWPQYPDLYPKVIYLIRDPRSVILSYFHHYRAVTGDMDTPADVFVTQYLSGSLEFDSCSQRWDKQVEEWIKRSKHQPVLLVKYEDMLDDCAQTLEYILQFIGVTPCEPELLKSATERGSFEAMSYHEAQHGSESFVGDMSKRGRFIRSGKRDSWKTELSVSSISAIEASLGHTMKMVGYL